MRPAARDGMRRFATGLRGPGRLRQPVASLAGYCKSCRASNPCRFRPETDEMVPKIACPSRPLPTTAFPHAPFPLKASAPDGAPASPRCCATGPWPRSPRRRGQVPADVGRQATVDLGGGPTVMIKIFTSSRNRRRMVEDLASIRRARGRARAPRVPWRRGPPPVPPWEGAARTSARSGRRRTTTLTLRRSARRQAPSSRSRASKSWSRSITPTRIAAPCRTAALGIVASPGKSEVRH